MNCMQTRTQIMLAHCNPSNNNAFHSLSYSQSFHFICLIFVLLLFIFLFLLSRLYLCVSHFLSTIPTRFLFSFFWMFLISSGLHRTKLLSFDAAILSIVIIDNELNSHYCLIEKEIKERDRQSRKKTLENRKLIWWSIPSAPIPSIPIFLALFTCFIFLCHSSAYSLSILWAHFLKNDPFESRAIVSKLYGIYEQQNYAHKKCHTFFSLFLYVTRIIVTFNSFHQRYCIEIIYWHFASQLECSIELVFIRWVWSEQSGLCCHHLFKSVSNFLWNGQKWWFMNKIYFARIPYD